MEAARLDSRIDVAEIGPARYVVAVIGEVAPSDVKDALYPLAGHAGASVVVDLASTPLVPKALVSVLTGGAHLIRTGGGELVVVTRDPRTRWFFDEAGLARVARIEQTLSEAIRDERTA
jgi:anti-anti-sigma regulatory factor